MDKLIAAARALVARSKVTTALYDEVDTLEAAIAEYDAAPVAAGSIATPAAAAPSVANPTMPPAPPTS